ncbi:MAG: glycosyltransferase family 4 protein [Planctomycetota bacterium]|nr:glycosyltransferase family 4 protein [Planctomycetota bacterium]
MKTGHFVPLIACKKGFANNVSGHVQMPLHSMRLLADAGHEIHLITNPPTKDRPEFPKMLPKNITIHYVQDGRKRTKVVDGVGGKSRGISIRRFVKQLREIKSIIKEYDIQLFHSYGYGGTATLTSMLRFAGVNVPKIVTLYGIKDASGAKNAMFRNLWNSLTLVSPTAYVADLCAQSNLKTIRVQHGSIRNFVQELDNIPVRPMRRVLFWRDPTLENGADICVEAFNTLASKHVDVTFEMAIRPHWDEIDGIDTLEAKHKNVLIHKFPYKDGVNLADLVTGSCIVVLPFRKHSIHPQLAIAESLSAGIPVITSDLCSAPELVQDGINGRVVPVNDVQATTTAIEKLLSDPTEMKRMGERASETMKNEWSWENYVDEITEVYKKAVSA